MRQKCLLFFVLLTFTALTSCGISTEQTKSAEDQVNGPGNAGSSISTVEEEVTEEVEDSRMKLQIGKFLFTATLVDNSTTDSLREMLTEGPITINMRDYASMEKVGSFGTDLPRNDEQITTEAGDLILYQGNAFVIYYAPNSWNFTRIGKIDDVTPEELKKALGSGDVTITLSLD